MVERGQRQGVLTLTYLGWLYLVQGVPYGLQDKFIPVQLRAYGLQYSSVSLLKLLLLPWIGKGVWAPWVEVWGGRHRWLVASLVTMAAVASSACVVAPTDVTSLGVVLFVLNLFSAIQDVAVDGLALDLLPDHQLGLGNTLQVVLYKVGCLVGGAGLTHLLAHTTWSTTFSTLAAFYLLTALWATYFNHTPSTPPPAETSKADHAAETSTVKLAKETAPQQSFHSCVKQVKHILREVISLPGTVWLSLYVLFYKMGERGALNNLPLYLLDQGVSVQQLAFWNGTVCQGLSILGSVHGGAVIAKVDASLKSILLRYSSLRLLAVTGQLFVILQLGQHSLTSTNSFIFPWVSISCLCLLSYSGGVISTASFTLMMQASRSCSKQAQASHYSVLASIEVAGKLLFAVFAGFIVDYCGMVWTYFVFTSLCLLPLILLGIIPHNYSHLKKYKLR